MPPMIPNSLRRLSLSFCLALALAAGSAAAPVQEAAAATTSAPAKKSLFTQKERVEIANDASATFGLSGEKDKVIRSFFPDFLEAAFGNSGFTQLLNNAKSETERSNILENWMIEHAKRNLYRLSFKDQRAFQTFMLAAIKTSSNDLNACYGFLREGEDLDAQTITMATYRAMSSKDFKDFFAMLLHAASLEDTERLPPKMNEALEHQAVDELFSRIRTRFYQDYPKAQADALWAYQTERKSRDKFIVCHADMVLYEEVLATRGENARILMQTLSGYVSKASIQNGYPF